MSSGTSYPTFGPSGHRPANRAREGNDDVTNYLISNYTRRVFIRIIGCTSCVSVRETEIKIEQEMNEGAIER